MELKPFGKMSVMEIDVTPTLFSLFSENLKADRIDFHRKLRKP